MTAVFVRGGEVSLEDRHFRQIGMVLAIGVVHAVLGWRPPFKLAAGGLALVLLAYGATTFVVKLQRHIASGKSSQGFRHMVVSQQAMDFIQKNLTVPPNGTSLLVVPSAEVGLEFPGRRIVEIPGQLPVARRPPHPLFLPGACRQSRRAGPD